MGSEVQLLLEGAQSLWVSAAKAGRPPGLGPKTISGESELQKKTTSLGLPPTVLFSTPREICSLRESRKYLSRNFLRGRGSGTAAGP